MEKPQRRHPSVLSLGEFHSPQHLSLADSLDPAQLPAIKSILSRSIRIFQLVHPHHRPIRRGSLRMALTPEKDPSSVVAIFGEHMAAEEAVKELKNGGFNVKKLSIIGRDFHTEDHVVGFYNTGDRVKYWGSLGAFWGGLWGLLFGAAFLFIPGIGPVIAAGSVVSWIIAALEGAIVFGGLSALGAGLVSFGIPKDSVVKYETDIKAGKFMLIAHGTADEVQKAREILQSSASKDIQVFQHAEPVEKAA
jgi:hypothetical protein